MDCDENSSNSSNYCSNKPQTGKKNDKSPSETSQRVIFPQITVVRSKINHFFDFLIAKKLTICCRDW